MTLLLPLFQLVFLLFFFLSAMSRTSKSVLSSSGESGHHCLVPTLSRSASSFSPLKMMSAVGLLYSVYID